MDILKLITEQLGDKDTLGKLVKTVGAQPKQVEEASQLGIQTLLQALRQNVGTSEGAASLAAALDQHKDDEIDDVNGFLDRVDKEDGAKILQHVFAGESEGVHGKIAKKTGMDTGQVSGLMTQLAPLLMGVLAQQKKKDNLDSTGVAGLLSGLAGEGGASGMMGMVTDLLDADNDGNVVDDVGNLLKRAGWVGGKIRNR